MQPLTLEAEITDDGKLHVDLPPNAPRGRVVLTVVEPASSEGTSFDVSTLFEKLADEWRQATEFVSSLTEMVTHPAYQRIIGLGNAAIPLLLNRLGDRPEHWFWALKAITGADPVAAEDRGNIDAMRGAWLAWGQREGYC